MSKAPWFIINEKLAWIVAMVNYILMFRYLALFINFINLIKRSRSYYFNLNLLQFKLSSFHLLISLCFYKNCEFRTFSFLEINNKSRFKSFKIFDLNWKVFQIYMLSFSFNLNLILAKFFSSAFACFYLKTK